MKGWICLHRKIRNNPIFNNLPLFRLWIICLTEATHKDREQPIGNQVVHLKPGEFVTGRFDLNEMYNDGLSRDQQKSPKTTWRWLEALKTGEYLTIKTTNKFSVVTVLHWEDYQERDHANDQQVTNKRPTDDQQMTTNNNVNNDNNVNNNKPIRRQYDEQSSYYKMALYFFEKICEWTDKKTKPNLQTWSDEFRKISELDKREKADIKAVIDWTTQDSFWQANVLSPTKLRKQFERLQIEMERSRKIKHFPKGGQAYERSSTGTDGHSEPDPNSFVRG